MKEIEEKLEKYSDELFHDLGDAVISEEEKADLFARIEEHLHHVILDDLNLLLDNLNIEQVHAYLDQGDYGEVEGLLQNMPDERKNLLSKIDKELSELNQVIAKEQSNARANK